MTYVWGVAFSKDIGAEKTPCSSSARCVSTFYAFFSLIVINTYCANLMAFLVQESFELPISGIRDSKVTIQHLKKKTFKINSPRKIANEQLNKSGMEVTAYCLSPPTLVKMDTGKQNYSILILKTFCDRRFKRSSQSHYKFYLIIAIIIASTRAETSVIMRQTKPSMKKNKRQNMTRTQTELNRKSGLFNTGY